MTDTVTRVYQERLAAIRTTAAAMVGAVWDSIARYDDRSLPGFLSNALPVVAGAQIASAQLTDGYFGVITGRDPLGVDLDSVTGAAVRNGADPADVYKRSFITVWTKLGAGARVPDAVAAGRSRALLTAETDVALTTRATAAAIGQSDERIVGFQRVPDGAACEFCLKVSGQRYRVEQLMPLHPRCVPVGSTVAVPASGGSQATDLAPIQAMTRRWHLGDLAVLKLASGNEVSVTTNHPILTQRGWVPAGLVSEGDDLFSHDAVQREHRGSPHKGHRPALVEDVWRALSMSGRLVRMPLASEDLHGDGTDGEIDVVWADGDLSPVLDPEVIEPLGDLRLMAGHLGRARFAGEGTAMALLDRVVPPLGRGVCCLGLHHPLSLRHLRGPDLPGPTSITRFDAPGEEFSLESAPSYARRGRDLIGRLAGEIRADRVVKTGRIGFRGHVYNLQTAEGWFASGCHIVSNCGCTVSPILSGERARFTGRPDKDLDTEVAVHEHGELGPVLTDAHHAFTSEGDI